MGDAVPSQPAAPAVTEAAFSSPPQPASSSEYITVLAHFHRAEIGRMAGWRDRIDRTSNWAITGVGAMLSLSLSTPNSHHGMLLFTMLLVLLFLVIEARRYRFFDVYRRRVRLIERDYFAPLLLGEEPSEPDWARRLGISLRTPVLQVSLRTAMSRRLRRNYIWIFTMVLLAWILKLATPRLQDDAAARNVVSSLREAVDGAALGFIPGWLVVALVCCFYVWIIAIAYLPTEAEPEDRHGNAHV
ncbi:MAG: DUF2270 domain-containing protein [Rhizobiaceae bacterium]|nr:DUF2270 domain-containing protein [Rhizobiaceae bacterium]